MSQILARDLRAQWDQVKEQGHASEGRQPRRIWAAEALKAELTEPEWEAAQRAVRECILWFPGAKANHDRVDMAWSDAGIAKQMDAGRALYGLRTGVRRRCEGRRAPDCAEWIVQLWTLQDIAGAMGFYRSKGQGREREPDMRRTKPFVRLVLIGMANYYADCDEGVESWRGAA